jgi:hypothetical protein
MSLNVADGRKGMGLSVGQHDKVSLVYSLLAWKIENITGQGMPSNFRFRREKGKF